MENSARRISYIAVRLKCCTTPFTIPQERRKVPRYPSLDQSACRSRHDVDTTRSSQERSIPTESRGGGETLTEGYPEKSRSACDPITASVHWIPQREKSDQATPPTIPQPGQATRCGRHHLVSVRPLRGYPEAGISESKAGGRHDPIE